ncbi:MAG: pyridoxine 5'-phosphate synthase [Acidobacteriota bacterium]
MSTLSSSPEPKAVKLSVNVDHVATLREARKAPYPSPVEAARIAEDAGAHGITVHLREDRRHIQDDDLVALRPVVSGKLNLEIAATEAMLRVAEQVRPDQVTLVPERPDEITTEGGLDLVAHHKRIQRAVNSLRAEHIDVSIFIDPDAAQLDPLLGLENVLGFEINTDAYTRASGEEQQRELEDLTHFAAAASAGGLQAFAGHGLTTSNVGPVAAVPQIEELNIGHWLVSRSVMVGLGEAVREMQTAIDVACR